MKFKCDDQKFKWSKVQNLYLGTLYDLFKQEFSIRSKVLLSVGVALLKNRNANESNLMWQKT